MNDNLRTLIERWRKEEENVYRPDDPLAVIWWGAVKRRRDELEAVLVQLPQQDATFEKLAHALTDAADDPEFVAALPPATPQETINDSPRSELSSAVSEMRPVLQSDHKLRAAVQAKQETSSEGAEGVQGLALQQSDDTEIVNAVTRAMREADRLFETVGGSTRHHVRDCLLPVLNRDGWRVVKLAASPPAQEQELVQRIDRSLALGRILGPEYDGATFEEIARELVALKAQVVPPAPSQQEQKLVEPEAVVHYDCPKADREDVGDGIFMTSNPLFRLRRRLDDKAGHQLRYFCEKCDTEITVNFPPLATSPPAQELTIPWRCSTCSTEFEMPVESYTAHCSMPFEMPIKNYMAHSPYRCAHCGEWAVLDGHQAVARLLALATIPPRNIGDCLCGHDYAYHVWGSTIEDRGHCNSCGCEKYRPVTLFSNSQSAQEPWTCKARKTADPPQDCDWPFCGCDPYADKVMAALNESANAWQRAYLEEHDKVIALRSTSTHAQEPRIKELETKLAYETEKDLMWFDMCEKDEREIKELEERYDRLNLCPDHRDTANGRCIVCVAEERTKAECAREAAPGAANGEIPEA